MSIRELTAGFERFRQRYYVEQPDVYQRLVEEGQAPHTLIVACGDARVDPALLFDTSPGSIFVIRNVANIVPPYETMGRYNGTGAGLEFGVLHLRVRTIIVLGHSQCGGVRAMADFGSIPHLNHQFLRTWVQTLQPALVTPAVQDAPTSEERLRELEKAAVKLSVRRLREYPFVGVAVEQGRLTLQGWYFDMEEGRLVKLARSQNVGE